MNKEVYLVLQYDHEYIYLPFKSLEDVDNYTIGFDNPLELVASTSKILELNIPNEEILDAYLSDSIDKIEDDMQEFKQRYLSIKYRRDDYDKFDLEKNFIKYLTKKNNNFDAFNGLDNVKDNYQKKYANNREINNKDIMRIGLLYLDNNYKRHKEAYFILKDNNCKTKIKEKKLIYSKENLKKMDEEDKMLLINGTNMNIAELQDYISKEHKGRAK